MTPPFPACGAKPPPSNMQIRKYMDKNVLFNDISGFEELKSSK
jgi:hypothetical protein